MLLGRPKLLGQRRDLLAQIRRIAALSIQLPLLGCDRFLRRLEFLLQFGALRIEPFDLLNYYSPAFSEARLLCRDILAFDINGTNRIIDLRELPHQVEDPRLVLFDFAIEIVERKLAVAERLLPLVNLPAM